MTSALVSGNRSRPDPALPSFPRRRESSEVGNGVLGVSGWIAGGPGFPPSRERRLRGCERLRFLKFSGLLTSYCATARARCMCSVHTRAVTPLPARISCSSGIPHPDSPVSSMVAALRLCGIMIVQRAARRKSGRAQSSPSLPRNGVSRTREWRGICAPRAGH